MVCNNLNLYFTDNLDIKNAIQIINNKINKIVEILKNTNIKKSIVDAISEL